MSEGTNCTVTLRLIRSFPHRNIRHVVYKNVDLNLSADQLKQKILEDLPGRTDIPPPFKKFLFDTMKIEHKAHGAKSSDPVINTENDDTLILKPDMSLQENGIAHETEISCFMMEEYTAYKRNPTTERR